MPSTCTRKYIKACSKKDIKCKHANSKASFSGDYLVNWSISKSLCYKQLQIRFIEPTVIPNSFSSAWPDKLLGWDVDSGLDRLGLGVLCMKCQNECHTSGLGDGLTADFWRLDAWFKAMSATGKDWSWGAGSWELELELRLRLNPGVRHTPKKCAHRTAGGHFRDSSDAIEIQLQRC